MPVCTTPMCTNGKASVDQMQAVFKALGSPDAYVGEVASIQATFDASYSWADEWIPFNPNCCTIQSIGAQADALTARMDPTLGSIGGPSPVPTSDASLSWAIPLVAIGFLLFAASPYIRPYLRSR